MQLLKTLARTGIAEILMALKEQSLYFSEIVDLFDYAEESTASSLVSRRLRTLRDLSLINRDVQQDRRRRVRYSLSRDGEEVADILFGLKEWSDRLCE